MSDESIVVAMLTALRLEVPPDELPELVDSYPGVRADLDLLYQPAFAEADPYLVPSTTSELAPS
jgi:hypothetical protein